jgi:uncharacterized protein YcbX
LPPRYWKTRVPLGKPGIFKLARCYNLPGAILRFKAGGIDESSEMALTLSQIFIYPIKSLGGIALDKALVQQRGLQYDRRWMLVDAQGHFLSQRTFAEMALLQVQLLPAGLQVTHRSRPELAPLLVPYETASQNNLQVMVWEDSCEALEVSAVANAWFSQALGLPCRLVFMPDNSRRQVDLQYARAGDITSFADAFPLLLIGAASLADLNARLSQPLPINRFRPNLVFSGGSPFEEDAWSHFRIGDHLFQGVKPCARCVVPTIDQQTARKGMEPTRTLATYRQQGHKILFGQNVLALTPGHTLAVGDTITVESRLS